MSVRIEQLAARERRHRRVRAKISGSATRPRLSVFRSLRHSTAQLVDDTTGSVVAAASDRELGTNVKIEGQNRKVALARLVGESLAKKAIAKGIAEVVFDRGGYAYHGRVKSLAGGARAGGLKL